MDHELYRDLLEHEQRIESRAFTTLGSFLMANAFMFVAWATLYVERERHASRGIWIILISIAFVGYFWGLAWALVGARNWEHVRRLVGELILVGGKFPPYRRDFYQAARGVEQAVHDAWKDSCRFGWLSYNATLLSGTPLTIALLYLIMLVTLLCTHEECPPNCTWAAVAILIGSVGVVLLILALLGCVTSVCEANNAVERAKKEAEQKA